MDILTPEARSRLMSKISSKNTKPELIVRSLLYSLGFRFRLHRKDLPGNPDIVLPKYKTVIFVHGCFWHMHSGCKISHLPKSNELYWKKKLERNVARWKEAIDRLESIGWRCLIVWECETKNMSKLEHIIYCFLAE
jgi:DNA mismatch endonuclease (patch repair protein)